MYTLHFNSKWNIPNYFKEIYTDAFIEKCHGRDEFTCGDGACIERNKLCDQVKDCTDGSDENNYICREFNIICCISFITQLVPSLFQQH